MSRVLQVEALPGYEPEIGRWLWALEEVRRGTLATVQGLDQRVLDWEGPKGGENSIGSLLYHIALVEVDWLFTDILEEEIPADLAADFPYPMADGQRRLARVPHLPLVDHLARLARSRAVLLRALRAMSLAEWRLLRAPGDGDYRVTPEWAVFHLIEHEAGHLFQIRALKARAARHFTNPA
jgi:uncharacterized damage-inducible protein DinB